MTSSKKINDTRVVTLSELRADMCIHAYVGFSKRYQSLDADVAKWLRHNFRGSKATVGRSGQRMICPVEKVKVGDALLRISDFPSEKKLLTRVKPTLMKELHRHGFVKFEVTAIKKTKRSAQSKHQEQIEEAKVFVEKVAETVKVREHAVGAVEEMLDNARSGQADTSAITEYVNTIIESSAVEAVNAIASLKESDQTYAHCVDAASIFHTVYSKIKKRRNQRSVFQSPSLSLLAGFMHDVGKSQVPKDILESKVRFERDSPEMQMMQSHPAYGAKILSDLGMPEEIINIAHYHHVKMDTSLNSSYPVNVEYDDVFMETRLVSIVDVYQALIGQRSYKKSWPPAAAIRYIGALAGVEFDPKVWDEFVSVIGVYPVGSLVELTDGSVGFIISVPEAHLNSPQVVIVQNAEKELLEKHTLVDLTEEQELMIAQDLDHYEVFGDQALDIFVNLKIS